MNQLALPQHLGAYEKGIRDDLGASRNIFGTESQYRMFFAGALAVVAGSIGIPLRSSWYGLCYMNYSSSHLALTKHGGNTP